METAAAAAVTMTTDRVAVTTVAVTTVAITTTITEITGDEMRYLTCDCCDMSGVWLTEYSTAVLINYSRRVC